MTVLKNVLKFAAVKLAVMLIVDIIAVAAGFLANTIIGGLPIKSDDPASVVRTVGIISSAVAAAVFFGYNFRTVVRMKNIAPSPAMFALKETAVYALFLLPLVLYGFGGHEIGMLSGVIGIVYAPHVAFSLGGLGILLDAAAFIAIYALTNYAAAVIWRRKHAAPAPGGDGE